MNLSRNKSTSGNRAGQDLRTNRRIRVSEVSVVDAEGKMIGTMATSEAIRKAEEQGLDLVEINPKAKPPICKILDYGKFKYEKAKKEREDKKNRKGQELKEILFRPKTGEHDYDFKVKSIKKFLEEGNKVKLVVRFRGRETMHPETGKAILDRVCKDTVEVATVIQIAQFEGRMMSMTLGPKPTRVQKPKPPQEALISNKE